MDLQLLANEIGSHLFHEHHDAVLVLDAEQRIYTLNKAAESLFQCTAQELSGEPLDQLLPPETVSRHREHIRHRTEQNRTTVRAMNQRQPIRAQRPDGTQFPAEATIGIHWHQGQPYYFAILRDLTQRIEHEQALLQQRNLYRALSRSNHLLIRSPTPEELYHELCRIVVASGAVSLAWIGLIDETGKVYPVASHGEARRYADALEITTHAEEAAGQGMVGQAIRQEHHVVISHLSRDPCMQPWQQRARAWGLEAGGSFPITRGGTVVGALNIYARQPTFFTEEIVELFNELAADVSSALERHDDRLRIKALSYSHFVTGLPNRTSLKQRLEQEMERIQHQQDGGAVIMIDIDGFKAINDSLGYRFGDEALRAVAKRIRSQLDGDSMIAHIGGDEFVVLLADRPAEEAEVAVESHRIAELIRRSFLVPLRVGERELQLTASLGISLFPRHEQEYTTAMEADGLAEGLLQEVSLALARAKGEGGNQVRFFNPQLRQQAERHIHLTEALRLAPERHELAVAYQPLCDLASGQVIGLEALMRWHHPETGQVSPAEFIPIAERSGLINDLSDWILEQVLQQIAVWRKEGIAPLPLGVAINVSPAQFKQDRWVESVRTQLRQSGIQGRCLKLEVTETLLMENVETALDKMNELRELGVHFALDDFGTGYSSLAYLQRLPLDYLKVDRSFIQGIGQEAAVESIIDAILALSASLEVQVIAEGVETAEQAAFLRRRGCDIGQGFYWAPPLAPEALTPLLPRRPTP
ncbi:MAG: EAL domain-containing protein [Halorhodospira sp.]